MNKKIGNLIDEFQIAKEKQKDDFKRFESERFAAEQYKNEYLYARLKIASARRYRKWLRGFLSKGGIPTHYYNYNWSGFIATEDIELKPLFGAQAICIIIPCNIKITGHTGHSKVFLMKDFGYMGWGSIPVYKNTVV